MRARDGRDPLVRPRMARIERRLGDAGREAAGDPPSTPRGSLALAMAAQRFLEHLDATPGVPVPASLRARIAASWPLHGLDTKRSKGS